MVSTASTIYVQQKLTWHMFIYYYQRQIDLNGSRGDQDVLGHPQRPRQAQPLLVQQVPVVFIKN